MVWIVPLEQWLAQSVAECFHGFRGGRSQHPHLIPDLAKHRAHLDKFGRDDWPSAMMTRYDAAGLRRRKYPLHRGDMPVVILPGAQAEAHVQ